jgi:hypothetical protein
LGRLLDGKPFGDWRAVDGRTTEVAGRVAAQTFRFRTGWSPGKKARCRRSALSAPPRDRPAA